MSDIELRELHQKYWTISKEHPAAFPSLNFEEFSAFLNGSEDQDRTCFISSLRQHYWELVEKSVPAGLRVIEKYLQPDQADPTNHK